MSTHAPTQLSQTDEEAEQRWEQLDEVELDAEIDAYRASLRQTNESLAALGISPDWEGDHGNEGPVHRDEDRAGACADDDTELR